MKKQYYFVPSIGKISPWAANYGEKIGVLGAQLGLTAEQIGAQKAAAQGVVEKRNKLEQKRNELAEAVSAMKLLNQNELKVICDAIIAFKRAPGYTENTGRELGVVASTTIVDPMTAKPSIRLSTAPGQVNISFRKQAAYGVTVFSRLKGTDAWQELGSTISSPFIDKRSLAEENKPEPREYMARCYNGVDDFGQPSAIETIIFGG
jgi:hypothetical protein